MTTGNPKANEEETNATSALAATIEAFCVDAMRVMVSTGRLDENQSRQCLASAMVYVICKLVAPGTPDGQVGVQLLYDAMTTTFNRKIDELRGSNERN
jgi:hypothetical protein